MSKLLKLLLGLIAPLFGVGDDFPAHGNRGDGCE